MLSITREMAKKLYRAQGPVTLFEFHRKFGEDPFKILIAAKFFQKLGIAKLNDNAILPAPHAQEWIFRHRKKFFGETRRHWIFTKPSEVRAFEPYLPELRRIDFEFFTNLVANREKEG